MEPEIVICRDPADLAAQAAERVAGLVTAAGLEWRSISIALAGGSTPRALYQLLAAPPYHGQLQWPLVHFFWGDERAVPAGDKDSNYQMAWDALLSKVPVPEANIHRMVADGPDLDAAARAAEAALVAHFKPAPGELPRFDLVLLGLGDDGHTASLFPGMPSLDEQTRLVVASPPGRLPPPVDRLTLTLPVLNAAAHVLFLVSGAGKADTVRQVLDPPAGAPSLPAARVRPAGGQLTWMLDAAAAGALAR